MPPETNDNTHNDLASLSIRRPLLVLVLNLLIVLAGIAAIFTVEVRELPDVDRPIVSVNGIYPGASPETMDAEVTNIVEGAAARVSGVKAIRSSSEENNFRMRVEFSPSTDLDQAAADVREAISRVARKLPDAVERLTVVKADEDADPIIDIAVVSEQLNEEALTRIIEKEIVPQLISIDGVADVPLQGKRQRLLRIVVDPLRLSSYGLSVTDVATVLRNVPFDVPAGSFRSNEQELLVRANASVTTAEQVENIIIRDSTRIGDIAQVYFGPEDAESYARLNGQPVVGLGIVRQTQSNTIDISNKVTATLTKLNQRFDQLQLIKTSDKATFIRGSVKEVLITLLLTITIVIATIWLFAGSLQTTLIPGITIPVALIGTVAAIWLFGFSINILTLLALVLATGLVVDDAIVVLENIQRRHSQGLGPRAAAVLGTRQVFFAVVATSAVLISVFVPISLLPSTAGQLFREFGFVLAVAVAISSFVALSLVSTLSARLVAATNKTKHSASSEHHWRWRQALIDFGNRLANRYNTSLETILRRPWTALATSLTVAILAASCYWLLDRELIPEEDRGHISIRASGPDGVGLSYSERQATHIENILQPLLDNGEIEWLYTVVGRWDMNRVWISAPLAPWSQRARSQQMISDEIRKPLSEIPGVRVGISSPNSLNLRGAGGDVDIALLGNDYLYLYETAKTFARAIEDRVPSLLEPDISYQPTQPQLSVNIDRRRAADLGVPLDNLAATLRTMIDGDELIDLNVNDEAIPVFLQSSSGKINDPTDLINLYVSTEDGHLVPMSSIVSLKEEGVAGELDRHAQRRAVEIDSKLAPGYPMQTAVDELEKLADELLPNDVSLLFLGEAAALQETSHEVAITYAIALLIVFLVLIAQFENITSAIVITITVPFGIAAAMLALFVTGTSINIYSQIGLIMLIGLMAKNGILLVEFADQLRDKGYSVIDAIRTSAQVRLRPIVMTMISTILGGLPLILSSGPGAEARASIGWVIFGGLGIAALFTLYLTPIVYLGIARFSRPRAAETQQLHDEMQHATENLDQH